ncbi:unnamed protein product [Adineta ricciae]|uniref:Uncharacterized protein n=1 Tax=Adineta ricciae TaxID=249248 RepID=A0A815PT71_ADIRI|nr:unnamed protein product [Adineta ricciae]CAF1453566.1 unnamed protein product [Adineta ricciae]
MGGNSAASTLSYRSGNYDPRDGPNNACDNNTLTTYTNYGTYSANSVTERCGTQTGFYVTLKRGSSVVKGLQFCAEDVNVARDPILITLEGNNAIGANLTVGRNWIPIYSGSIGFEYGPPRLSCGLI